MPTQPNESVSSVFRTTHSIGQVSANNGIDASDPADHLSLMPKQKTNEGPELFKQWPLPPKATLGSAVRAKGILLEIRARLPAASRKLLDLDGGSLVLAMPETSKTEFRFVSGVVSQALVGIESLAVIPREIQDILTISPTERLRWLTDGRLPSAGTRTVRLAGRAKKITFHVFDPRLVEELLDGGTVDEWREDDKAMAAENRRRAALKTKLTRSLKTAAKRQSTAGKTADDNEGAGLSGWEEFGRDGLLG